MKLADERLRRAQAMRKQAAAAENDELRTLFLDVAQHWERMAEEAQQAQDWEAQGWPVRRYATAQRAGR